MLGWLIALFRPSAATPEAGTPGAVAQRTDGLSRRAFRIAGVSRIARRQNDQTRIAVRTAGVNRIASRIAGLTRIVEGNTVPILQTTLPKDASETVVYIADFSRFDEADAGETLSTPVVDSVSGLTIGAPTVISSETNSIPSGYGIKVAISGGTAGTTYNVEFRGTFSGGSVRVVKLRLEVE